MFNFNLVEGIIFDLDDTLVASDLNFALIKSKIGCSSSDDILAYIDSIVCTETKERANKIVLEHELDDAACSVWMPGAEDFVKQALARNLPLAIVTRNCRQATEVKLQTNNIPIELVITREDAPPKPDPEALLMIATQWQIDTDKIAYIGDYSYDIEAAHNASMQAWLYQRKDNEESRKYAQNLTYIAK